MKAFLGEFEELVLLATRRLEPEAYGVPIGWLIEGATRKRVSTGALYTALGRLEAKGYLTSRLGEIEQSKGGRAKKYFNVADAGSAALESTEMIRQKLINAKVT